VDSVIHEDDDGGRGGGRGGGGHGHVHDDDDDDNVGNDDNNKFYGSYKANNLGPFSTTVFVAPQIGARLSDPLVTMGVFLHRNASET
jgi:hypothetical protein